MMSNDAAGTNGLIKDTTTQTFMADVIQESMNQPVLVDFWAEWCGPCKQLGPILEKTVLAAKGKVKLVKMDIDKYPQIAGQLGVQSIPAVFAFSKGQPVDGFMGAIPESQIKEFIAKIAGPGGDPDTEAALAEAEALLNEGEGAAAAQLFAQIFEQDAENLKAIAGLARCALAAGELEQAKATLSLTPKGKENDPLIASARAALELAEQASDVGDLQGLARQVEADPKNFQAKFDYALALAAANRREDAVDQLLDIARRDRKWNDDGARKQLVQFFEAWGPMDESTIYGRRRLSSILFS
ncbi:thioredoxin [Labrys sp. KNU-23]|uniref:thioredoxin n=1 Tax=Labrys sp. KNU-23 TaxID=2789216 RepID=UPI0011F03537|nr:thioredoxin [Labrys sp. KNU-23]QEN86157.1 thioredoxin [Labrys sp. KNU-23]